MNIQLPLIMTQAEVDESKALVVREGESNEEGSEEEDDNAEPVESLVAGREKRKTAGSRYNQLITASIREDADDDIALLFAEEEGEDEEFDEDQVLAIEANDVDDNDSSSDEEDKAGAEDDELAGEKQLEKEARAAKRAQKQKAQQVLAKAPSSRKRVRIAETTEVSRDVSETPDTTKPLDKKRKRSAVSLLQQESDGPVRTSSRTLTVQNKERTMESIKEAEERRLKALKNLERSQKRKEANKKRPMTQAEKLAEAAKVERINSRSLNKWEQAENERMARQKARLDALHNRILEGPVIRWYSGPAEWTDGKLTYVGRRPKVEEVPEEPAVPLSDPMQMYAHAPTKSSKAPASTHGTSSLPQPNSNELAILDKHIMPEGQPEDMPEAAPSVVPPTAPEGVADISMELSHPAPLDTEPPANLNPTDGPDGPEKVASGGLLDELEYYAALEEEKQALPDQPTINAEVTKTAQNTQDMSVDTGNVTVPQSNIDSIPQPMDQVNVSTEPLSAISPLTGAPSSDLQAEPAEKQYPPWTGTLEEAERFERECPNLVFWKPKPVKSTTLVPAKDPESPAKPQVIETSARNLLTLVNFDENATASKDIMRRILFKWPSADTLPNTATSTVSSYSSSSTATSGGSSLSSTTTGPGRRKTTEVSAYIAVPPVTPTCVITGKEARYLDPLTGLPYRGMQEFKMLRRMAQSDSNTSGTAIPVWSSLLDAYVGAGGRIPAYDGQETLETIRWRPARGVSDAFVGRKALPALPPPPAPATAMSARSSPVAATSPRPTTHAPSETPANLPSIKTEAPPPSTT